MATPTAFVHVISYSFWGTCCCHYNSFNIISQWFIKENFWMILVWMMTVMITTRSSCKARTTGKQQSHSRSPYSPIKKHQQRVCSFLSALERVLDLIPKQKNKSMSCLSVRWRCLCCLVKLSGLWRIGGNEWQKKEEICSIKSQIRFTVLFMCPPAQYYLDNNNNSNKKSKIDFILTHESIHASWRCYNEIWLCHHPLHFLCVFIFCRARHTAYGTHDWRQQWRLMHTRM